MKKEILKGYVVGAVSTALVAGAVVPAVAQSIDVSGGVRIFVDDMQLQGAEGFIYNGTTYLPVRQISDAVGKPVSWDGKTRSVYIGRHESSEPAVMLADLDYSSKKNSINASFTRFSSFTDNMGNSYHDAVEISYWKWQEYKLNGNYSKIKGRAVIKDRAKQNPTWFKVYGDGKLLYTSPDFKAGTDPVDFEVDLTGVLTLKIESEREGFEASPDIYLVNTGLYQ